VEDLVRTLPAAWAVAAVEAAWLVSVSLAVVAVSLAWIFANRGTSQRCRRCWRR